MLIALFVVAVAFAVTAAVSNALTNVDTSGMPDEAVFLIEQAQYVFLTLEVAVGTGYLANISGFIVKWLNVKRRNSVESVDYSMTWLVETVGKFEAVLITATPFMQLIVPPAYKETAMLALAALFALIKVIYSETKRMMAEVKKPG